MPKLIIEPEVKKPLLGIDWLRKFKPADAIHRNYNEVKGRIKKDKRIKHFVEIAKTSQTNKQTDNIIQLKPGHSLMKQKN